MELPANSRHLDTYRANIVYSDKVFHCTAIGAGRAIDGIRMTAIARGASLDEMARRPGLITIISVNSPRRFDESMCEGLIAMAEHGQAVVITPFTLMGAMAPASLAAALAQQNAEALVGHRARSARASRDARHVWRVHLERRHALRSPRIRHAGERQGQRRERSARAALSAALSNLECERLERRGRARRLRDRDVALGRGPRARQSHLSRRGLAGGRAHGVVSRS